MAEPGVGIEGLGEFRRALKQVDRELPKQLRAAMRSEVADPVAEKVKSRVPVRSGRWLKAIRGGATQRTAYVQWGRASVPYAGWMEFGGGIPNKRNRTGRARVRRPFVAEGRYVHPVVSAESVRAGNAAEKAMLEVMVSAKLRLESQ